MSISDTTAALALTAIKGTLDGGRLYLFAGPVPSDADDALDLGASHTQIAEFTVGDDGATGLTFSPASGPGMVKNPAEAWEATIAFDGAQAAMTTLTPTFWRFGAAGDDCRDIATGARLQGSAGGPLTDLPCGDQTDNGANTLALDTFVVAMDAS
ncbi:hypothetical protein [Stenotrophomonas sp. PS02298]|uniref:hypothetical protein n=1 Tax=Stenotrophomonas sp. PS02298 TaxID=2991424 RepID=UPI002499D689|nr:hypothetical protein [Stenotrophomonas sp. PS02298]